MLLVNLHTTLLSLHIYYMPHHHFVLGGKFTNTYLTAVGDALNWSRIVHRVLFLVCGSRLMRKVKRIGRSTTSSQMFPTLSNLCQILLYNLRASSTDVPKDVRAVNWHFSARDKFSRAPAEVGDYHAREAIARTWEIATARAVDLVHHFARSHKKTAK